MGGNVDEPRLTLEDPGEGQLGALTSAYSGPQQFEVVLFKTVFWVGDWELYSKDQFELYTNFSLCGGQRPSIPISPLFIGQF